MASKRDQKFQIPDKSVDSHREFLDMDTDEEDFGRQESPEVEEDLPSEPEKPVFTEEDLITLARYVKDLTLTTFPDTVRWNERSDKMIQEYFANPSHTVLSIFYEQNELNAVLSIPMKMPNGFAYFLRSPWQIYTPENFHNTVLFGTVNRNVKNTILKFMENMYAPIVLHSDDCTSFLTNERFTNLHQFIMHLMDKIYKPLGLTMLYIPRERLLQTFSKSWARDDYFLSGTHEMTCLSNKRELINRLEKIICFWIKQIYEATSTPLTRENINTIQDEVNYWKAKQSNLNYLHRQLLSAEVRLIIDILRNLNSMSIIKLEKLEMDIETGLKETSSNLMYLNVLLKFCKNMKVLEDAENSITEALLLVLFIWTEAPYYSTTSNMSILSQAFSSQIIHQCREYIKFDVIFGNNPQEGIDMLKQCIFCCNKYKEIYDNLTLNFVPCLGVNKKWSINKEEIFNKIYTFEQRCNDAIELCNALIVFGRNNKADLIGGPRGVDYEAYWQHIELLFYKYLNDIVINKDIMFDVTNFFWCKIIKRFKHALLQLENMVVNLINDIFENVQNIEEGVEAIYALEIFKKREKLRELLQNKWTQVWQMFSDEIKYCYINTIVKSKKSADSNENLICASQYLKYQYSVMINASDWIGECEAEKCTLQQYEYVLRVIDERRKMFNIYNAKSVTSLQTQSTIWTGYYFYNIMVRSVQLSITNKYHFGDQISCSRPLKNKPRVCL